MPVLPTALGWGCLDLLLLWPLDSWLAFYLDLPSVLGSVDFCLSLPGLFQLRFLQARFPQGSGHTWMSRGPSADTTDNDEISLAVVFQGLRISVVGPAPQALDFVNKLVPGHHAPAASYPAQGSSPTPSSSVPARDLPAARRCPDSVLALATRLSAASILSPQERIERAWTCGLLARAQLDSGPLPTAQIISIDLPNKYYVVFRGRGVEEPKILKSQAAFQRALQGLEPPEGVGHEFPSETEARAYLTAAGWGHFAGC